MSEVFMMERADLLRAYARILDLPRKGPRGEMIRPSDINQMSARCLRIVADAIDRGDPHLPPEWL